MAVLLTLTKAGGYGMITASNKKGVCQTMENNPFAGLVKRAEKECDVYCPICHKVLHLQPGDVIPRCCGKLMEVR